MPACVVSIELRTTKREDDAYLGSGGSVGSESLRLGEVSLACGLRGLHVLLALGDSSAGGLVCVGTELVQG